MKRFLVLILAILVLLVSCGDVSAVITPSSGDVSAPLAQPEDSSSKDPDDTTADETTDGVTSAEETQPDCGLEISLLDGEKLLGSKIVDVSAFDGDKRTAKLTVAVLSCGDSVFDSSFYIDFRDSEGKIVSFRRYRGIGFVAVSDSVISIFTVRPDSVEQQTVVATFQQLMVSDMELTGAARKLDILPVKALNENVMTRVDNANFGNFRSQVAEQLSSLSNPRIIAESSVDGGIGFVNPERAMTAEDIAAIKALKATDYAEWFK